MLIGAIKTIMLSFIMLSEVMLTVIKLIVIMLNVGGPLITISSLIQSNFCQKVFYNGIVEVLRVDLNRPAVS